MANRDKPPFWVKVDNGLLAPLTEYDERKIMSYKNGAEIRVNFWQGRSLPELRKYWAILDLVIEQCKTPWSTPEEASDALKLELGVTDVSKTVRGQWFVRPGSISFTEMEESAFLDFRSKAFAVLEAFTGVDPWTLQKEAANTELPGGREPNPDPDQIPDPSGQDEAEEEGSPHSSQAASSSADEQEQVSAESDEVASSDRSVDEGGAANSSAPSSPNQELAEGSATSANERDGGHREIPPSLEIQKPLDIPDIEKERLIFYAQNMLTKAGDPNIDGRAVTNMEKRWAGEIKEFSNDAISAARAVSDACRHIRKDEMDEATARNHIAKNVLGCDPSELEAHNG